LFAFLWLGTVAAILQNIEAEDTASGKRIQEHWFWSIHFVPNMGCKVSEAIDPG